MVALLLRRREWSPGGLPASAEVSQLAYGGAETPTRAVGFQGMCGRNVEALRRGQAWRIYLMLRLDPELLSPAPGKRRGPCPHLAKV